MPEGIEDSIRSLFEECLRDEASLRGARFRAFPLNAQDTYAAGDVIYSDTARLTLIEFKSYEASLKEEKRKPRRKVLCDRLIDAPDMREFHDQCHLAAWNMNETIFLNIYRNEICHQGIYDTCKHYPKHADLSTRFTVDDYADQFFNSYSASTDLANFEKYLAWVLKDTSGSKRSTVSVQARDTSKKKFAMLSFDSIRAAHDWLLDHKPHPRYGLG